jgi:type I restriction enzyme S subunit
MSNINTLGKAFLFIRNGKSIKQSSEASGVPITRIETIADKSIDKKRLGYANIEIDKLGDFEKYLLEEGDILMSHINSPKHLGKTAIYKNEPEYLIHGMNLLCLRVNNKICNPEYANYFFQSRFFNQDLMKISNKSVNQASFSVGRLKDLKIPLPPLKTQKHIAQILDDAAALRDKTKQLLTEYDLLAQAIFLDMFGDSYHNPKDFDLVKLNYFIEKLESGKSVNSTNDKYNIGEMGILKTSCVYNGVFDVSEAKVIRENELNKAKLNPQKDSIIISRMNTEELVGKSAYVDKDYNNLFLPDRLWQSVKSNVDYSVLWLSNAISQNSFMKSISRVATGTSGSMKNISQKKFLELKIINPPIKLQNQFAEKIELIEKQKELTKQELQESEDLFNCLLQKAFKGKLV